MTAGRDDSINFRGFARPRCTSVLDRYLFGWLSAVLATKDFSSIDIFLAACASALLPSRAPVTAIPTARTVVAITFQLDTTEFKEREDELSHVIAKSDIVYSTIATKLTSPVSESTLSSCSPTSPLRGHKHVVLTAV